MKKVILFALSAAFVSGAAIAQNQTKGNSQPMQVTTAVSNAPQTSAAKPATEKKEVKKETTKAKKESKPATK